MPDPAAIYQQEPIIASALESAQNELSIVDEPIALHDDRPSNFKTRREKAE